MLELKTVRKKMFARDLKGLIDLPDYDDNQRVNITVTPDAPAKEHSELSAEELKKIVASLVGAIPYTDKTLDELRLERLERRYEIAN